MMNQWGNGGYLYYNLYDRTAGGVDRKKNDRNVLQTSKPY